MSPARTVCLFALALLGPGTIFGQTDKPCFAFLLDGDVRVSCGGSVTQITRQGDIRSFAVSSERFVLGYIAQKATKVPSVLDLPTTLVNLRSGAVRRLDGAGSIYSTCGGLFWGNPALRSADRARDLVTGGVVTTPYDRFRCTSDRKVVIGAGGRTGGDLFEGVPPRVKIVSSLGPNQWVFALSPNGSQVAYFASGNSLCVVSPPATAQCSVWSQSNTWALSVDDSGGVLFNGEYVDQVCNGFPCPAVGYWRPGLKDADILVPLGYGPQWITPAVAEALRSWAARSDGGRK